MKSSALHFFTFLTAVFLLSQSQAQAQEIDYPISEEIKICGVQTDWPALMHQEVDRVTSGTVSSIQRFCQYSTMAVAFNHANQENNSEFTNSDRIQALKSLKSTMGVIQNKASFENRSDSPWGNSLFPDERIRAAALTDHLIFKRVYGFESLSDVRNYLQSESAPDLKQGPVYLPKKRRGAVFRAGILENAKQTGAVAYMCGGISALFNNDCTNGVNLILEWATPEKMTDHVAVEQSNLNTEMSLMMPELYHEIRSNPKMIIALTQVALSYFEKLSSCQQDDSDLFNDIYSQLQKHFSKDEAYENTWKVLGFISTAGANVGYRLWNFKNEYENEGKLKVALDVISFATMILDIRYQNKQRLYSLPATIKTTCDNAKYYHFWMSAYLARRLVQNNIRPKSAIEAAYILQKGYQMKFKGNTRNLIGYFMYPQFYNFHNVVRMDLTYSAVGATFGANSIQRRFDKKFDFDLIYTKMLNESEKLNEYTRADAEDLLSGTGFAAYREWNRLFKPDVALKEALQQADGKPSK